LNNALKKKIKVVHKAVGKYRLTLIGDGKTQIRLVCCPCFFYQEVGTQKTEKFDHGM